METFETVIELAVTPTSVAPPLSSWAGWERSTPTESGTANRPGALGADAQTPQKLHPLAEVPVSQEVVADALVGGLPHRRGLGGVVEQRPDGRGERRQVAGV